MRLKVLLPTQILLDEHVTKVIAEAENGSFCLLPRHVDFAAALVPGILSFTAKNGGEHYLALDEGALIKCGAEVLVSTFNAIRGRDLGALKATVKQQFSDLDEHERMARTALARLEAGTLRRFTKLAGLAGG